MSTEFFEVELSEDEMPHQTEEPIQPTEDSNHSNEEQSINRPLRFGRCCCPIKTGLIVCHILLFCAASLNLLMGFKNLRDIIINSFLLAYVLTALIITCKFMRRGMVLIALITLPVMAACITSNILQLLELADNLDPWYNKIANFEQVAEYFTIAIIIFSACITSVCGILIFIHTIILLRNWTEHF